MLRNHRLKPMAMAPVVALTSANMFVPEGSIRAGVVRDLFDERKSSGSSWLLTLFTVALAIVTLLPTGGMSAAILVPASLASAGLAAYLALKIYQRYEKQKLLVNTDLDLARALSNQAPVHSVDSPSTWLWPVLRELRCSASGGRPSSCGSLPWSARRCVRPSTISRPS